MADTTLLFLHAHPDDECILTGATMARAKSLGMRTIVAYATRGDAGETSNDLGGETLGEVREREARAACDALGVDRVLFLGFDDSGMEDTETTKNPTAFCNADLDEVTARLSLALVNETITAVIGYDRNGTYGHPDHIQIHHAAHAAAPALKADWVLDATYNREYLASLDGDNYDKAESNPEAFATSEAELTHFVDDEASFLAKMTAITHHQSQMPDEWKDSEAEPPVEEFAKRFGTEWFVTTAVGDTTDFGALEELLRPKAEWSSPQT